MHGIMNLKFKLFYFWCDVRTWKQKRKTVTFSIYRGADKSLAQPGRKQANVSVRMAWISLGALYCRGKKLDNSSRLDVVEIALFAWLASELFSFLFGLSTYQHLVNV